MRHAHEWVRTAKGSEAHVADWMEERDPDLLLDEMDLELRKVREAQEALEEFMARHGLERLPYPLWVLKNYCSLLEDLVDARWRLLNRARDYRELTGKTLYLCTRCYDFYTPELAVRFGQRCAGCGGDLVPQDELSPNE